MKSFIATLLAATLWAVSGNAQVEPPSAFVIAGHSHRLYETGTHISPMALAPTDVNHIQLIMDVTEYLDPAVCTSAGLESSADGGQTWRGIAGFTRCGGPTLDRQGRHPFLRADLSLAVLPGSITC
jgi:hypothetical protein